MFSWKRPENLGVKDGRLARPKRTPNCVSSQADPADREHYIAPLKGEFARVRTAVESMPGSSVITAAPNYLYAEFRTRVMRFVDDLELYHDGNVIHVRSASRLGRRDFGVNRARVESLRDLLK